MSEDVVYSGHVTMSDGTHVQLPPGEAEKIIEAIRQNDALQAERMPTSADALRLLCDARERLRRLGWRDGMYCPKDGTEFAAVEYGSTGIFTATMTENWPNGFAYVEDNHVHLSGIMWKPLNQLTADEEAARQRSAADTIQYRQRLLRTLAILDDEPEGDER